MSISSNIEWITHKHNCTYKKKTKKKKPPQLNQRRNWNNCGSPNITLLSNCVKPKALVQPSWEDIGYDTATQIHPNRNDILVNTKNSWNLLTKANQQTGTYH